MATSTNTPGSTVSRTPLSTEVTGWLSAPFSESMSAAKWFLFLGFAIIVSLAWHRIIDLILDNT